MGAVALTGRTVVVTGDRADAVLTEAVDRLAGAGCLVAVVALDRVAAGPDGLSFVGDATDPSLWQRVGPQVEQRLGPLDAVVVLGARTADATSVVVATLGEDLVRRAHSVVLVAGDLPATSDAGLQVLPLPDGGDVAAMLSACWRPTG